MIQYNRYLWDYAIDDWQHRSRRDYTYDSIGNLTSELYSYLQIATGQWEQGSKLEYTYDEANNETSKTYYFWDIDRWIGDYKSVAAYNTAGNRTLQEIYRDWDIDTEQWIGDIKYEYGYDADENYVLYRNYTWNADTYGWENDYQLHINYDNTYPYSELILPYSEVSFRHKRTDYTGDDWDTTTGQWITDTRRGTYYYSEQLVGIDNIVGANINVFPNPARDEVVFDLKNTTVLTMVELYDAQGKLADVQSLNNNKISVRQLTPGVYFYRLLHETQQYGGKLIVQ